MGQLTLSRKAFGVRLGLIAIVPSPGLIHPLSVSANDLYALARRKGHNGLACHRIYQESRPKMPRRS